MRKRPRLVYVTTHPVTADLLLRGQLAFMRERGFDVTAISSPGAELDRVRERERVRCVGVPMPREIGPRADVIALARLTSSMRKIAPDIVNAGTPKAGLLGMVAARFLRVPIRIYLLRGLRLETATGAVRSILASTERIASACAHDVACVSPSLLRISVDGGYIPSKKAIVIGGGSSNGVDTDHFRRSSDLRAHGGELLAKLGVRPDDRVIGFVGRPANDKGIAELLESFSRVQQEVSNAKLVLLGGGLAGDVPDDRIARRIARTDGVLVTGRIDDLRPYYARMDVLAFPSLREGMPNAVLEAASAEVPVVAFRSTGVVDAVVNGETGALVERGDIEALADGLARYLRSDDLSRGHGKAARARVIQRFERRAVWASWLEAYCSRLEARGLPLPTPEA